MESMAMTPNFWNGKSVFISGHTGFKGGWLSLWLQSLGAKITGYSLRPPAGKPSLFDLAKISTGIDSHTGDIRDLTALSKAMMQASPDIVFHLAAQPLVRYSYREPVETYSTNVLGTVNVLEAIRANPSVRAAVIITTDKCYENKEWPWGYRETDDLGGYDPYSSSKACAELVASAYQKSFFNPADYHRHSMALATTRAGNVIGGGDFSDERLIPDALSAFAENKKLIVRNPCAVRPWQHVLEPLYGYLKLAQGLVENPTVHSGAWNFGPKDVDIKPVHWIVSKIAETWGDGSSWETADGSPQPHETTYLKLDCSKANVKLGWYPRWDLESSIQQIVNWEKARHSGADMRSISLAQISDYSSKFSNVEK